MTEKELRRLSRVDLLEIMVEQGRELEKVKAELEAQRALLDEREIKIEKAGSLAEASFAINGVIEAADAAAKQYLDNLQNMNESQEEYSARRHHETEEQCRQILQSAEDQADALKKETTHFCEQMKANVEEYCLGLKDETDKYCNARKSEAETECSKMKNASEKIVVDAKVVAQTVKDDAERQALELLKDTQSKANTLLESLKQAMEMKKNAADEYYNAKIAQADAEVEEKWADFSTRMEAFYNSHAGLRELVDRLSK